MTTDPATDPTTVPATGPDAGRMVGATGGVELLDGAGFRAALGDLALVLEACVAGGASIGFVEPFHLVEARRYWEALAPSVEAGERLVLVVRGGSGAVVGTVQLVPAVMPNGSHRAEVAKLLVHPDARRSGHARRLMEAVERRAVAIGRSLLVLDTATDAALRLYADLGYREAGQVPGYARSVDGSGFDATTILFKELGG